MKKILVSFGTRPEAIKMCPVIQELQRRNMQVKVCVTGQHKEMLEQVLRVFKINPNYNLNIMKEGQTLYDITIEILKNFPEILKDYNPDIVLVHGDTTSAFAVALSCFYRKIPIAHVEAGLRTYDLDSPYPEEFNRHAISIISQWNFAPTVEAKVNLLKENVLEKSVYVTGNTVIDALKTTVRKDFESDILRWSAKCRLILLTAHRRENLGTPMREMFMAVRKIAENHSDIKILYPVHMNPQVQVLAKELLGEYSNIKLIKPMDVIEFHNILAKSYLVLTDSGGIQEEASALGKPVLVMRDNTERPEGIKAGILKLVGTKTETIYAECEKLLADTQEYNKMSLAQNPYGDGQASKRIADILEEMYG